VTLFVNPYQIEAQRDYWFTRLDALLDATSERRVTYQNRPYTLDSSTAVRQFRLAVKTVLMRLSAIEAHSAVDELADALGARRLEVPEHGRVLPVSELIRLQNIGVSVDNHGWDHRDIGDCKSDDIAREIIRVRNWILGNVGKAPRHFAVPYGLARLNDSVLSQLDGLILLADSREHAGNVDSRHWNRSDITGRLSRGAR
jgi:peptidoglycan/xylan/chitin deacetylase (PgdA/CDA1 family)